MQICKNMILMAIRTNNQNSFVWVIKLLGLLFIGGIVLWGGIFLLFKQSVDDPSSATECIREEPYSIPPEFVRALSLINQRLYDSDYIYSSLFAFNCLNITYGDTHSSDAEGYFYFDPESPANNLKITVDSSYQSYDDYLTAILLAHELRHAYQLLEELEYPPIIKSCYDKEVEAFEDELAFINSLNKEEFDTLRNKIYADPNKNPAYIGTYNMFKISDSAANSCSNYEFNPDGDSEYSKCYWEEAKKLISQDVTNSEFYQKQCAEISETP